MNFNSTFSYPLVAPIVNISFSPSSNQSGIREGSDVYLECCIWSNPWIFEIAWQFEDRPIAANMPAGIIISNQTLMIQNVKKDHRGRYRCHAANIVGHGYSRRLHLLVQCLLPLWNEYSRTSFIRINWDRTPFG
ncbi:uncharacterized protein TNCV_4359951 [Trichonephila clavipes]|uniref:Ig-like domain-containing protein n=1 Tax=Trichonephila clavipes TaxID=2585209 RepID=A0A8X6W9X6_TRICX|nr:uncharacterized protein TNCV_4359951 [Trichonephila clavipes]